MALELVSKVEQYQENYHRFTIPTKLSERRTLFVGSDIHLDNLKCNRKKLKDDLEEAKEQNALIFLNGDILCLMQGKYDPRSKKSALRPEYVGSGNYLDNVLDDATKFLLPYAENILLMGKGNHETSVSNRIELDILGLLVSRINDKAKTNIQLGAYRGYFTLNFIESGRHHPITIGYSHGNFGGNITKSSLSVSRNASIMPDCDIMLTGHTHDSFHIPHAIYSRETQSKRVRVKNQHHIKTGTYKEEFDGGQGWAVEKIAFPKVIGGAFVQFKIRKEGRPKIRVSLTAE